MNKPRQVPGSFRDPSGFLYRQDGLLYRQINKVYQENYDLFMGSGLYKTLVEDNSLIPHEEVNVEPAKPGEACKVIKPETIDFISYPYGWCFSQLKDAALLTLQIQKKSLDFGMSLKDASSFNIQFRKCKPVFIDTLSFEKYQEGQPWVAYRQFCQHFLAPLVLMSYTDIRLNRFMRIDLDGIPLDFASKLLPFRTRFNISILSHIHLHAKSQIRYSQSKIETSRLKVSRLGLRGLIDNLESTVKNLQWKPSGTEWADYYNDTNYSQDAFEQKKQIVDKYLDILKPGTAWDLGANTGIFSRIASKKGIRTISFDSDPAAVERNYLDCRRDGETLVLPLVVDLTNPSPSIGWQNHERMSLIERGPADTLLALALVHHLAISNNVPLSMVAEFFSTIGNSLIIEFVPKTDSQVQRLLVSRKDIFSDYTQQSFEDEFRAFFTIEDSMKIKNSDRIIYLMRKASK